MATAGYPLAAIAALGFVASLACHVLGWLQVEPPGGKAVMFLHVGFLVLWFPLVIYANRTMPRRDLGNMEHLLAEFPSWMRIVVGGLFGYAVLNFVYFFLCTRQFPRHGVPFTLELRGFSGHWMLFYGIAAIGFFALAGLAREQDGPKGA